MSPGRPVAYSPRLKRVLLDAEQCYRRRDDAGVERLLSLAHGLAPHRTDILFNLAGRHIQSADIERAVECYRRVLSIAPADVDGLTCLAHWTRFLRRAGESEAAFAELSAVRPSRAADLGRIWNGIDADADLGVSDAVPPDMPGGDGGGEKCAVVIFGYRLNDDGSMHGILAVRLAKGLEAAMRFPRARIVVTGGVPRAGRVEAAVMRGWLAANGVDAGRVDEEGYARDVVENCLYARHILDLRRMEGALIVTSALDVRRARVTMGTAAWAHGSRWAVRAVASDPVRDALSRDPGPGGVKIYRDALRVYGMPMMRVYPEMTEL